MIALESRTGETVVCAVLLAIAIGTGIASAGMPMGSYNLPGPGVFPLALSVLLGAAAALRIAWLHVRPTRESGEIRLGHRNIVIVCVALAGVAVGLDRAGFLLTAGVFLVVLYRAFSEATWWRVIVSAAAALAGFHLFFERFIGITLPMGVLG
ncbi:MAG: tripartite tricarboxylate transporter TctB family protein [Thiotrichales bacterium]|nr:tripartite tricarboxylate transporter TctB family protein [Thiotrichales bacterium]